MTVECYYFRNDFSDLIQFDPTVPPFGMLVNVGRARTHGVELLALWQVAANTIVDASYTRTDSENAATGQPLPRRPWDKGSVGVRQRFADGRASARVYALMFGKSLDSFDGTVVLDGYTLLNMTADYQFTEHLRGFCRFDNLLNQHYEVVYGYATPGSSAFGGVELQW